jgi:hypothetical protein
MPGLGVAQVGGDASTGDEKSLHLAAPVLGDVAEGGAQSEALL